MLRLYLGAVGLFNFTETNVQHLTVWWRSCLRLSCVHKLQLITVPELMDSDTLSFGSAAVEGWWGFVPRKQCSVSILTHRSRFSQSLCRLVEVFWDQSQVKTVHTCVMRCCHCDRSELVEQYQCGCNNTTPTCIPNDIISLYVHFLPPVHLHTCSTIHTCDHKNSKHTERRKHHECHGNN